MEYSGIEDSPYNSSTNSEKSTPASSPESAANGHYNNDCPTRSTASSMPQRTTTFEPRKRLFSPEFEQDCSDLSGQDSVASASPNTRHLDVLEAQQIENLEIRIDDLERERHRGIMDTLNSLELRLWQLRHRTIKLERNKRNKMTSLPWHIDHLKINIGA